MSFITGAEDQTAYSKKKDKKQNKKPNPTPFYHTAQLNKHHCVHHLRVLSLTYQMP